MADFEAAVAALVAIGPLASQRDADGWLAWPEVVDLIDEGVPLLLVEAYVLQEPVPLASLVEATTTVVRDAFDFGFLGDQVWRRVDREVSDVARALELAGVLTRQPAGPDGDLLIELTPAGQRAVRKLATDLGIEAPVAGRPAEEPPPSCWPRPTSSAWLSWPARSTPGAAGARRGRRPPAWPKPPAHWRTSACRTSPSASSKTWASRPASRSCGS